MVWLRNILLLFSFFFIGGAKTQSCASFSLTSNVTILPGSGTDDGVLLRVVRCASEIYFFTKKINNPQKLEFIGCWR
jgi:hypothetical protein